MDQLEFLRMRGDPLHQRKEYRECLAEVSGVTDLYVCYGYQADFLVMVFFFDR